MKFTLYSSLLVSSLTFLSGCGSQVQDLGLDTAPITGAPNKGVFVNSVEGLEYTRTIAPVPQTTDKGSHYAYRSGELINFHVGNLQIGDAIGLSIITPKDIVSYKNRELNTSIYSSEVNNRVRLLMALDSDGIYSNGIQISQASRDAAKNWSTPDYALNEADFNASVASATASQLTLNVTKAQAETQFSEALRCVYSGAYRGSWIMPSGAREGFVGVMIQSNGYIVALGDGQDVNNTGAPDVIYSDGQHNMDTGVYDFSATYYFDVNQGRIVSANLTNISGIGTSQGYNRVSGSFIQDGVNGAYTANRVGEGLDTAYRYTGFGYLNTSGGADDPTSDPILGLFTFDISRDGNITGLIHDARTNEEPTLTGTVNFSDGNVSMNLNSGEGHTLSGTIDFVNNSTTVSLQWYDANLSKLGYINGVGCQLQPHN